MDISKFVIQETSWRPVDFFNQDLTSELECTGDGSLSKGLKGQKVLPIPNYIVDMYSKLFHFSFIELDLCVQSSVIWCSIEVKKITSMLLWCCHGKFPYQKVRKNTFPLMQLIQPGWRRCSMCLTRKWNDEWVHLQNISDIDLERVIMRL